MEELGIWRRLAELSFLHSLDANEHDEKHEKTSYVMRSLGRTPQLYSESLLLDLAGNEPIFPSP